MAQSSEGFELPLLKIDLSSLSCSAGLASRPALDEVQGFLLDELHLFLFEIIVFRVAELASCFPQDFHLAEPFG